MKPSTSKRVISLMLLTLIALLPILSSCAQDGTNDPKSPDATTGAIEGDTLPASDDEIPYEYAAADFGGGDFRIYNYTTTWGFYSDVAIEDQTGEALDDAIYARNVFIEEKYNVKIKEINEDVAKIESSVRKLVLAGEDLYDIILCPGSEASNIGVLVGEKLFYNLNEFSELKLDQPWWDQGVLKEGSIGADRATYFAISDINITNLQGAWCLYFNEDIMKDYGMEKPYDLVRSGNWTIDELRKYIKAGTNLNGDANFTYDPNGKSIYGLTSYESGVAGMLISAGGRYISKDANGIPQFVATDPRFVDICQSLASLLGTEGEYVNINDEATNKHYELAFLNGRALFCGAEIKASTRFRSMEQTFGIVPMPKFDSAQSDYYAMQFRQAPVTVIPVTNLEPNRTAAILDAMAYKSYVDVTPVYYDVTMSQKGLRNEESIEMLKIIRNSRYFDSGIVYGWTKTLYDAILAGLVKGNAEVVSNIEKNKAKIEVAIDKTLTAIDAV